MPLNHNDVALLQSSIRGVGDSFRQSRLDDEARKQRQLENELRTKALANQTRQLDQQDEGVTEAYLQGQDGMIVGFRGSPSALQAYSIKAGLKPVQKPTTGQHPYKISFNTPDAEVTAYAKDAEELERIMGEVKKAGGKPKTPGTMETSATRNFAKQQELQEAIDSAPTPEAKAKAEQTLEQFKEFVRQQKSEDDPSAKELDILKRKRLDAEAAGQTSDVERIDDLILKRTPVQHQPSNLGELRRADEQRMMGTETNSASKQPSDAVNVDALLAEANAAIAAGAPRAAVIQELKDKYGITIKQ